MTSVGNSTSTYDREAISGSVPTVETAGQQPSQSHFNANEKDHAASDSDASTIAAKYEGSSRSHNHHTDQKESSYNINQGSEAEEETTRRENAVLHLARRLTSQSHSGAVDQNPFNAAPNSSLDPNGNNFNARAWTKAMLNLQLEDEHAAPPRTAGVSFKNLNVHGFG